MNLANRILTTRSHSNLKMLSPQTRQVLEHLEAKGSITNVEANAVLKCRSVSRRISELKDRGFAIETEYKRDSTGQRYVRYSLA